MMPIVQARTLRKEMTQAERKLWKLLRSKVLGNWKFRRQHPIGQYIADFVCVQARLIVEVDGGQHSQNSYDAERTAWLESCGWNVLRFWNNEVMQNADGVIETIGLHLNSPSPSRSYGTGPSLSHRERVSK